MITHYEEVHLVRPVQLPSSTRNVLRQPAGHVSTVAWPHLELFRERGDGFDDLIIRDTRSDALPDTHVPWSGGVLFAVVRRDAGAAPAKARKR